MSDENKKGPNVALQARNAATAALIEAHQDEWNDLMDAECEKRGITWARPLTPEQKAANDIAAYFDKYPHLREQFAPTESAIAQGIRSAV